MIYRGRLVADGNGHLLADEGENIGFPVAWEDGQYVFVGPGEPSHNERHEKRVLAVESTVDESMTDDKSLVNAEKGGKNSHHFAVHPDDAHYDKDAPNKTRMRFDPDAVAARVTGHTDAYTS